MFKNLFLFLCLFLLLPASCGSQPKEELFADGIKKLEEGDARGATVLFKSTLKEDPNFFEARLQLAKAYVAAGKFDSAERELKKVIAQNPSSIDAPIEIARVHVHQSKPDEALEEISAVLEKNPENAEALVVAGIIHASKGENGTAEHYFSRAVSADKENADARVYTAQLLMEAGKKEEARSLLVEALQAEPSHRGGQHLLADMELREGDNKTAMERYDSILKDEPDDLQALYRKGIIYMERGEFGEALALAENISTRFPNRPEGSRLKGMASFYLGNSEEAIIALQMSVAIQPAPTDHYYLGLAHYIKGELEQALSQLQKTLDLDPAFVKAREMNSLVLLRQGRREDAIVQAKRAIENPNAGGLAHNVLGNAYLAKGMIDEGMEELNRALTLDPGLVDAHMKKGMMELRKGSEEAGVRELRAAVEASPDLLSSRFVLASYYSRKKDFGKAVETLEEGINGEKSDAVLHNMIASVLIKEGRFDEAAARLEKARQADPEMTATYFTLTRLHLMKGERAEGIALLEEVLEKSPENLRALLFAARMRETDGKDRKARKLYERAAATGAPEGVLSLAGYHIRKEDPHKALRAADEAISVSERPDIRLYVLKGKMLNSLNRSGEAIEVFEKVEQDYPGKGLPLIVQTHLGAGRPERAIKFLRSELSRRPGSATLKAELARILWISGQREQALITAREIIEEHPEVILGYAVTAQFLRAQDQNDEAVRTLRRAERFDAPRVHFMIGGIMEAQEDYDAAIREYRKAQAVKTDFVQAIHRQAVVHQLKGEKDKAVEGYAKVLSLSSSHVGALNNLAYLYAKDEKKLEQAMHMAVKAYTAKPDDGSVMDTLGFVLLKRGEKDKALEAFDKAAELLPKNPTVHYHRALAYREKNMSSSAVASLREAVSLGEFPEAGAARTLLAQLQGENEKE